jgi:hypothetical protein
MNTIQLSPKDAVQHEPLVDLVEEITARLQAGEPLDIDQYIADYPEYADKLRNWITVITAMAELGESLAVGHRASAEGAASSNVGLADAGERTAPHRPAGTPMAISRACWATTASSPSWAAAAWASCTRPSRFRWAGGWL